MNTEELEERLTDAERVLALHGKRLEKLENRKPAEPEPRPTEQINQLEEIKTLLRKQDLSAQALQIYAQIASFRESISKLPKVLPVAHHHYFEDRSRGFIFGAVLLLLVTAIAAGLCFSLYRENSRLQEDAIKLRLVRQTYPEAVRWADSTYHHGPEEAVRWLEQLEAKQLPSLQ